MANKKKAKKVDLIKGQDFPQYWSKDWVVAKGDDAGWDDYITYRLIIERTPSNDIDDEPTVDQVRLYQQLEDEFGCKYWVIVDAVNTCDDTMTQMVDVMARIISEEVNWD